MNFIRCHDIQLTLSSTACVVHVTRFERNCSKAINFVTRYVNRTQSRESERESQGRGTMAELSNNRLINPSFNTIGEFLKKVGQATQQKTDEINQPTAENLLNRGEHFS